MTPRRPLPTVIGPTENALRALLLQTLAATGIKSYSEWVVLNAAAARTPESGDAWKRSAGEALAASPESLDEVVERLARQDLLDPDGQVTPRGVEELAEARSAVGQTTAGLVADLSDDDQAAARRVLDHLREQAQAMLEPDMKWS